MHTPFKVIPVLLAIHKPRVPLHTNSHFLLVPLGECHCPLIPNKNQLILPVSRPKVKKYIEMSKKSIRTILNCNRETSVRGEVEGIEVGDV